MWDYQLAPFSRADRKDSQEGGSEDRQDRPGQVQEWRDCGHAPGQRQGQRHLHYSGHEDISRIVDPQQLGLSKYHFVNMSVTKSGYSK